MKFCGKRTAFVTCLVMTVGCSAKDKSVARPKAPRPVSVVALVHSDPGRFQRVTGSVASWKTDQLGFEVDGRIQFVIEPETDIAGQVYDKNGNILTAGTLLARLDPTRYELDVESEKAQVAVAEKQREATQIEYDRVIPAQQKAATALRDLANVEVEPNKNSSQKTPPQNARWMSPKQSCESPKLT